MQLKGSDANNRPCVVRADGEKLGGSAAQNWCFLRLLPILVGPRIKNPLEDQVWQLCLKLREIVEIACAPKIHTNQVAYLKLLVEEYLESRATVFSDHPFKPKHHFLLHYPDLIIKFEIILNLIPSSPVSVHNSTWMSTFSVPWEKMHESLKRCLAQTKRPKAADRRHMVRVIAEAKTLTLTLNPPFRQCTELAKRIVDTYPESFEDRTEEGERLGNGHFTLSKQLRTRIEFLNRDNTLTRLRKPKQLLTATNEEMPGPSTKCAKTDSYGCVNWQPLGLPEELLTIFSQEGPRAAEHRRVGELMSLTYEPQRRDINATPPPTLLDLERQWPFLFIPNFLLQHFCTLTGIEIQARLRESLSGKGKRMLQYFKSQALKWKKEVRTVLCHLERHFEEVDPGLPAMLVLMAYFRENEDAIFLLADETSTPADVEAQISLPSTPRLIMLGDTILGATRWMLFIEGRVILHSDADFPAALAVFFGSFYVFNIEYPEEAATSLEFVQRFFVRINPEQSKCAAKFQTSKSTGKKVQRKNQSLNPHVAALIQDFIEYDWQNT
uniref:Uncharacterized protein n=1 Tax=Sander lucioperca TaxID=283035 RepID=A0A8C9XE83_SANLU